MPMGRPNRREILKAGALPLMGLGMADLLQREARADARPAKAKSVLFLFMSGGPSQLDIWDLKPDAPAEIRGEFKPITGPVPGFAICEHLPKLAARTNKFALLRSLSHKSNLHSNGHAMILAGVDDVRPGFSPNAPTKHDWPSIVSGAGVFLPRRDALPAAAVLPHPLVHRTGRVIPGQFGGMLGPRHDPWIVHSAANCTGYGPCPKCFHFEGKPTSHDRAELFSAPANLRLPPTIAPARFQRRMDLLADVESQRRDMERTTAGEPIDEHRKRAISLLTSDRVHRAFDLDQEPAKLREAYGRDQFGNSLIMARRLLESGVRLVQVNLGNNETWDTHQSMFPIFKNDLLPALDRCLTALLEDLETRGLLDSTLIVTAGEFGRTPRVSGLAGARLPGRDHWGAVQSCFFAGGGVLGGKIVGSSDRIGGFPNSDPCSPSDLGATIYSALGIDPRSEIHDELKRPFALNEGRVIRGLFEG